MTGKDKALVAQYGSLKNVSGRVPRGETCNFRKVHVDAVIVIYSGPVEMPVIRVVAEVASYRRRIMARWLE